MGRFVTGLITGSTPAQATYRSFILCWTTTTGPFLHVQAPYSPRPMTSHKYYADGRPMAALTERNVIRSFYKKPHSSTGGIPAANNGVHKARGKNWKTPQQPFERMLLASWLMRIISAFPPNVPEKNRLTHEPSTGERFARPTEKVPGKNTKSQTGKLRGAWAFQVSNLLLHSHRP